MESIESAHAEVAERTEGGDGRLIVEVEHEICTLAGHIAAATAHFLLLLDEFDRRDGWVGVGVLSCAHWLSWKCGMGLRTARDHVRVAQNLPDLPVTRDAFATGRLSYSKVRAITRVATAETEKDLVDIALRSTASHVERLVRGIRSQRKPGDGDDQPHPSRLRLSHRWDDDTGDLVINGRFTAEEGAIILAALKRAEIERTRTDDRAPDLSGPPPADGRPATIAMAETMLATTSAPADAPAAEVSFVTDANGTHVQGGPPVDDAAAETVACSGIGRRVEMGRGRVLRFGRRRRLPSTAQLRALHLRDGACRTPTCGRTRFLHAHHVRAWSHGGATDLDNLILLCGDCHRRLHEGTFSIRALGEQLFEFRSRDGQPIPDAPTMAGEAAGVHDHHVPPESLVPDWDGEALHLGYAVSVLAQAWERDAQLRAKKTVTPSGPARRPAEPSRQ